MAVLRAVRTLCGCHLVKIVVVACSVWGLACLLLLTRSAPLARSSLDGVALHLRTPGLAGLSLDGGTQQSPATGNGLLAAELETGTGLLAAALETAPRHATAARAEHRISDSATIGAAVGRETGTRAAAVQRPQDPGATAGPRPSADASQTKRARADHQPGVNAAAATAAGASRAANVRPPAAARSSSGRRQAALSYTADGSAFLLDGKPFRILSGEVHYFRVVPDYWEDRLLRLAAAGLNTVSTYVAWNLHEPRPGVFDFRRHSRADLRAFVALAHRLGLYVILRPGPYICAEWEFGGLPAWLLREHGTEIRTDGPHFMAHARRYLKRVYQETADLQRAHGGPIIAVQIENEYGTFANSRPYLEALHSAAVEGGIVELLFKCDDHQGLATSLVQLPGVLQTVNSNELDQRHLDGLRRNQQGRAPIFVTEFWSGWYSVVGHPPAGLAEAKLLRGLADWLDRGASVSFYMWHGGSNFNLNGAVEDPYRVVTTSYDYDAPVSENGTLTSKFYAVRDLLRHKLGAAVAPGGTAQPPPPIPVRAYGAVAMTRRASLDALARMAAGDGLRLRQVRPMEQLPVAAQSGQSTGWTLYRHSGVRPPSPSSSAGPDRGGRGGGGGFTLRVPELADFGAVLFDGKLVGHADYKKSATFAVPAAAAAPSSSATAATATAAPRLDILVAHLGRNNYKPTGGDELKGLLRPVTVDNVPLTDWTVFPIEFSDGFIRQLASSASVARYANISSQWPGSAAPQLLYAEFSLGGAKPCDTYLRVGAGLGRGVVVLNGEILGRYQVAGDRRALYTPAPLLRAGTNTVILLELERAPPTPEVTFVDRPELGR